MVSIIRKLKKRISGIRVLIPPYKKLHNLKKEHTIKKVLKEINYLNSLSEEEIRDFQNKKLIEFINYAHDHCKYYKKIISDNNVELSDLSGFQNIPMLTKAIIKGNTQNLISDEYGIAHLAKKNTGGSTGNPLELFCTTQAGLLDYGFHFYQYKKMGYQEGDIILGAAAFTVPKELRDNNVFWLEMGKREPFGDTKLSILYLTEANVKYYVQKLLELKPAILRGYPSLFDSMAQYIIKNKINIDFKIKGISLTSEMCSRNQKINIEKAFASKVLFEYGHTEVCVLCHTSGADDIYKSYPSYGYVEVLNDDGTETEVGEVGNIVVTGFLNRGMPFIRYKTEDLGRLAYKNGGIAHFSEIIGRSQDFIVAKDKSKISISALTSWQHLNAFAHIAKWQIVQEEQGIITISIIKGENYSITDETEIKEKIQKITDVDIIFSYVTDIPRTKGGKHLFMIQKIA